MRFFNFGNNQRRENSDTGATESNAGGSYEKNVVRVTNPYTALSVAAWHRAVELRAKTMSQLVVMYQKRNAEGGNFTEDTYGDGRRVNYLWQVSPNPLMTASVLMQQAEIDIITKGNAFIYIDRNEWQQPVALWLATCGGYDQLSDTYSLTFNAPGGVRHLSHAASENVIHIPNTFRYADSHLGIPTIVHAANVLSLTATLDKEAMENAAKGGKMKLILQQDKQQTSSMGLGGGIVKKDQVKAYAAELSQELYSQDVTALHGIMNVTPYSMNAQQLQLFEQRQFSVAEVARMTGVPKALLMDDTQSSYKTPEAATQEFLMRTIQPKIREWENEINRKLLTERDFGRRRFHVCEQSLLRLDPKAQAELDKLYLETGIKSVNELRGEHDLPTIEQGETHYVSTNLAEIGSEKLRGNGSDGAAKILQHTEQPKTNSDEEEGGEA